MSIASILNNYLPEINNFLSLFREETPNRKQNVLQRYNASPLTEDDATLAKEAVAEFIKSSADPAATEKHVKNVEFFCYNQRSNERFRAPLRTSGDAHFVAYPSASPPLVFFDPATLSLLNAKEKKYLFTQQLAHFEKDHYTKRAQMGFLGPYVLYPLAFTASLLLRKPNPNQSAIVRMLKPLVTFPVGFAVIQPLWHFGAFNSYTKFQEFEADQIAVERMGNIFGVGKSTMKKIFLAQCKRDGIQVPEELEKKIMTPEDDDDDDDDDKKEGEGEEKKADNDKKDDDGDDDDDDDDDDFMADYNFVIATTTTFPSLRRRIHKLNLLEGVAEKQQEKKE